MSEGGIDYGGIVTAVIAAAAVVTIVRCLYAVMVAIARCLYAAMIAIARSLYGNTKRQQESFDEQEETEDDEEIEEAENVKWKKPESGRVKLNVDDSPRMSWKKPEIGWVKLNVDGSRDHHNGPSAGCGGVLRGSSGTWLMGFATKVDPTYEAHRIELQAILTGMEVVSEMNVKKLVVESDSKSAVSMVKNGKSKYQHADYDVVRNINSLLENPKWQATLDFVPRTANQVANRLANDARKLSSNELRKYPFPPQNCTQLLLEDNNGQRV